MSRWNEFRPLFELIGMGTLCGWTTCLAFGFGPLSPVRCVLIGIVGIGAGWELWRAVPLPLGPWVSGFPVIPSLAGTLLVVVIAQLLNALFGTAGSFAGAMTARRDGARGPRVLKDQPVPPAVSHPSVPLHREPPHPAPEAPRSDSSEIGS